RDWSSDVCSSDLSLHIRYNTGRNTPPGRINIIGSDSLGIGFPEFLFSQVLKKSSKTFIHPAPLALINIHDHRKKVVSYFVYDHTYHPVFYPVTICSVRFRTAVVPADHRILHSLVLSVNRDGLMIRILESMIRI